MTNLNFCLRDGDRLGIVGHNGAGKTTLLRILAGVYYASSGSIRREGRIAALFDISTGMDPESTGYENILLRGLYMGLSPAEIKSLAGEIAEFSDLGEFLSMPIRTYSAGMSMRLAFSVATSISSDILLLDEWLSVGDAKFIDKARERMASVVGRAKILILASHDLNLISSTCNKVALLEKGTLQYFGPVEQALERYSESR